MEPTTNLLEGSSSAHGQELSELQGHLSTRLRRAASPARPLQLGTSNATVAAGGTDVTLSPAPAELTLQPGDRWLLQGLWGVDQGIQNLTRLGDEPDQRNRVRLPAGQRFARPIRGFGGLSAGPTVTLTDPRIQIPAAAVGRRVLVSGQVPNRGSFLIGAVPVAAGTAFSFSNASGVVEELAGYEVEGIEPGSILLITDGPYAGTMVPVMGIDDDAGDRDLVLLDEMPPIVEASWIVFQLWRESIVESILGPADFRLAGLGAGTAVVTPSSWRAIRPADVAFEVETTIDFADEGVIYLEGVQYQYRGRDPRRLLGISYDDGTGQVVLGIRGRKDRYTFRPHRALRVLDDGTGRYSAYDVWRRSFLVGYATGRDLRIVGRNLGVVAPPALDDERLRRLIMAIAYSARGTTYSLELALAALVGADGFEVFEDLTLGQAALGGDGAARPCTVYVRRTAEDPEDPIGKAYLMGPERKLTNAGGSTVQVDDPPTAFVLEAIRAAGEPFGGERLVVPSVAGWSIAASTREGPQVVTIPTSSAINEGSILPGDRLVLEDGTWAGRALTVSSVAGLPATCQIGGPLQGSPSEAIPQQVLASGKRAITVGGSDLIDLQAGQGGETFPATIQNGHQVVLFAQDTGLPLEILTVDDRLGLKRLQVSAAVANTGEWAWEVRGHRPAVLTARARVVRPLSNWRLALPTAEVEVRYEGDTGTAVWTASGTAGTTALVAAGAQDPHTLFTKTGAGQLERRHLVGATQDSALVLAVSLGGDETTFTAQATDAFQAGFEFKDGVRAIAVGLRQAPWDSSLLLGGLVARTSESFIAIGATGQITCQDGATTPDGAWVELIDTKGRLTRFIFDKTSSVTQVGGIVPVPYANGDTATQVADAFRAAVNARTIGEAQIFAGDTDADVSLEQLVPGAAGNTTITQGAGASVSPSDFAGGAGETLSRATIPSGAFVELELRKVGTGQVELRCNGRLCDRAAYTAFSTSADTPRINIGCAQSTASTNAQQLRVRQLSWRYEGRRDFSNIRVTAGGTGAPRNLTDPGNNFTGTVGAIVRVSRWTDPAVLNAAGGSPLGEWEVEAVVGAGEATVIGPLQQRARFTPTNRRQIRVQGGRRPFVWPDMLGFSVQLIDENAGIFPITAFIDEVTGEVLGQPGGDASETAAHLADYAASSNDLTWRQATSIVEVDTGALAPDGLFDGDAPESSFRIVPAWSAVAPSVAFEIVGRAASYAAGTYTLSPAIGFQAAVEVHRSLLRTAQLSDELARNTDPTASPVTDNKETQFPLYLYEPWGLVRDALLALIDAGCFVDFDSLVRDGSGLHVLD